MVPLTVYPMIFIISSVEFGETEDMSIMSRVKVGDALHSVESVLFKSGLISQAVDQAVILSLLLSKVN